MPPDVPPAEQQEVLRTAEQFVRGWGSADPRVRAEILPACTTPQLLDGIASTRPDRVVTRTPAGQPVWIRGTYAGVEVHQAFVDGEPVALLVVMYPDSPTGWAVASVRPLR